MNPVTTQNRPERVSRSVCAALVCWALTGACGGPSAGPEEQLRLWVEQGQAAAEAKERRELLGMISAAYGDTRGNDINDIENMLRAYFFRQQTIKLVTSIEEIRLYGETAAEIDLTVGMAGLTDGVFGFNADAYRFQLELEQQGDEWQLISARWGTLGEELR
jgi:hypothetical protein